MECPWCKLEYEITYQSEMEHLLNCPVFQGLPTAKIRNDKEYVQLPPDPMYPGKVIFVERFPRRAN